MHSWLYSDEHEDMHAVKDPPGQGGNGGGPGGVGGSGFGLGSIGSSAFLQSSIK